MLGSIAWNSGAYGYDINITIEGVNNDDGSIKSALYNESEKEYFPRENDKAICRSSVKIENKIAKFTCGNIVAGEYALFVFHDENNNGEVDHNWFKLPVEGLGFSNDPDISFGPPDFEESKFTIGSTNQTLKVKMQYLF